MITVIVGHRGTGKSELVQRMHLYIRDEQAEFVDLDLEIEKKAGKALRELFLEHGETYFREMERQVFLETLQKPHSQMYLVLGAGFDLSVVPQNIRILWVKRATDLDGRIFLNRPRLDPDLSPLDEFRNRAHVREARYREKADEVYLMPEGIFENRYHAMDVEKSILTHNLKDIHGAITVLPEVMLNETRWTLFKERFADRGVSFFELRNDFLSDQQILKVLSEMPNEKFMYSLRKAHLPEDFWHGDLFKEVLNRCTWIDLAWELGRPDAFLSHVPAGKLILSLHEESSFSSWASYEDKVAHLKFAPEVYDFSMLFKFHQWQNEKPQSRSFLPRSPQGRWSWYRLWQKGKQLINFVREDGGSAGDQPSLWSWMMAPLNAQSFAAVLGDPVNHSYTPLEHSDFFNKKNMPVLAVNIKRDEWGEAFPILEKLHLTHAAVTAPHKENAAKVLKQNSFKAVNTLIWHQNQWHGTSTDDQGFLDLIEGIGMIAPLQKEIFVWGGGGVLEMIQKELPHATYFSSRVGLPRVVDPNNELTKPRVLIWAAPRDPETLMPPSDWSPTMVLDLNYKEDSLGREYAQACGANYQSGLVMFTAQAQGQRLFWRKCEEQ